jgi:hypothetical protein
MIYALLIVMTLLIAAFVVAWLAVPSLRQMLEEPSRDFLINSEKFRTEFFR